VRISSKSIGSMIEITILILVIAFVSSVTLQVFAKAYELKRDSADMTNAAILAENTLEGWKTDNGALPLTVPAVGYDANWNIMPGSAEGLTGFSQAAGDKTLYTPVFSSEPRDITKLPRYVMIFGRADSYQNDCVLTDGTLSVFSLNGAASAKLLVQLQYGDYGPAGRQ